MLGYCLLDQSSFKVAASAWFYFFTPVPTHCHCKVYFSALKCCKHYNSGRCLYLEHNKHFETTFLKSFFLLGTEKSTLHCNHLKSARTLVEMANIDDTVELRLQTVMIARVVLVLLRRMIKSANFYRVYEGIGRPRVARGLMTTNKVNLRRRKDEDNKTNNLEYI